MLRIWRSNINISLFFLSHMETRMKNMIRKHLETNESEYNKNEENEQSYSE